LHFYRQSVGVWLGLGILGLGNGKGFRVRLEYRIRSRKQRYAMVNSGGQVRGRANGQTLGGGTNVVHSPTVGCCCCACGCGVGCGRPSVKRGVADGMTALDRRNETTRRRRRQNVIISVIDAARTVCVCVCVCVCGKRLCNGRASVRPSVCLSIQSSSSS